MSKEILEGKIAVIDEQITDIQTRLYHDGSDEEYSNCTMCRIAKQSLLAMLTEQWFIGQISMKQALEDIYNISIGYDGFGTVKSLKKLIDELKDIAGKGLNGSYVIDYNKNRGDK